MGLFSSDKNKKTWFQKSELLVNADNGWADMQALLLGICSSVERSQKKLEEDSDRALLVIKDFRIDLPVEVNLDPATNVLKARLPVSSRVMDEKFNEQHLARVSFSMGMLPKGAINKKEAS